ncbi:unnamed protein product [Clonostachys solani]|uniref:Uncharacterized protein n=1 Tax=Clonostachys solani TaxID=160281 RepID=A0A9N9W8L6_9HYPO|nr:unnamed protein product [Clonostachys solani]
MTLFHVDASDPGPFEDDLKQAIQRGSMVMLTGVNWAGQKSWVESALKNAGFPSATVFWPTSGASILGVDFWEHDIAIKAIAYFNERNIDGIKLTPEFHQDVCTSFRNYHLLTLTNLQTPPEYAQKLAKASDSLPTTRETQTLSRAQRQALRFGRAKQPESNPEWPEDPRRCEVPMDVLTPEAPHEDIGRFFPRAIEMYSRQFGGMPSPYGLVKIEGQKLVPTPDQAKACVSFYKPENESDPKYLDNAEAPKRKLVVTSRGFVIPYPRGSLNGVGWGEFDKFTEWQLQGRKIEVDMLDKDLVFEKRNTRPLCFVSPAGGPQREPIVVTETLGDAEEVYELGQDGEQKKTLSELLTSKRKRNEIRGEIYGRGLARRRGGRGGRGGQGNGWP